MCDASKPAKRARTASTLPEAQSEAAGGTAPIATAEETNSFATTPLSEATTPLLECSFPEVQLLREGEKAPMVMRKGVHISRPSAGAVAVNKTALRKAQAEAMFGATPVACGPEQGASLLGGPTDVDTPWPEITQEVEAKRARAAIATNAAFEATNAMRIAAGAMKAARQAPAPKGVVRATVLP